MMKAYKVRLYPNKTQAEYFARAMGCCRKLYNLMLDDYKKAYAEFKGAEEGMSDSEKKGRKFKYSPNYSSYAKMEEYSYMADIEARVRNYVQQNFKEAIGRFLSSKGAVGFPVHKKRMVAGSFQSDRVKVLDGKLKIPMCPGTVKFRNYRDVDFSTMKTKTITISRTSNYKYYAAILVEDAPDAESLPKTGKTIGIDIGEFTVALDDGRKVDRKSLDTEKKFFTGKRDSRIKKIKELEDKIDFYEQRLVRAGVWTTRTFTGKDGKEHVKRVLVQETGNFRRIKQKIANLNERLVNVRRDFITKASKAIVAEADTIVMEDLKIAGMLKDSEEKTNRQNSRTHRNVLSSCMGMLGTKIASMAQNAGKNVIKVEPANTSKTCHVCGHIRTIPLPTSMREWRCVCGAELDRDVNAAINILNRGVASA